MIAAFLVAIMMDLEKEAPQWVSPHKSVEECNMAAGKANAAGTEPGVFFFCLAPTGNV